ncbi:MAG: hypothetical protein A4E69_01028 [Syntrophus sp. PtaB.Bin138]|nr:MAG: hypothetical protein A4E69_01028 [Syntrophus sp. PtaB.Bin138]
MDTVLGAWLKWGDRGGLYPSGLRLDKEYLLGKERGKGLII